MAAGPSLELRSPPHILGAYLLGALAGAFAAGVSLLVSLLLIQPFQFRPHDLLILAPVILIGSPVCLFIELCVATPVLWAINRWRWRWLSRLAIVALGLVAGALIAFLYMATQDGSAEAMPSLTFVTAGASAGAASAWVICLVAVRKPAHGAP
jgi:hypothetical protein